MMEPEELIVVLLIADIKPCKERRCHRQFGMILDVRVVGFNEVLPWYASNAKMKTLRRSTILAMFGGNRVICNEYDRASQDRRVY